MKPPGHTCPAIDQAQGAMRRLAWRAQNPDRSPARDAGSVLAEGVELLERVREENRQMRAAYWRMRRRLEEAGLPLEPHVPGAE